MHANLDFLPSILPGCTIMAGSPCMVHGAWSLITIQHRISPVELLVFSCLSHGHLLSSPTMAVVFFVVAATLYNGLQTHIFSADLSAACDAALNTSISCPEGIIQLSTYGIQAVGNLHLSKTI